MAMIRSALALIPLLILAGCERRSPEQPSTPMTSPASAPAAPAPLPTVPGPPRAPDSEARTTAASAKSDHADPDQLLRSYAAALAARDWAAAARTWGKGSGVTAATLKASYDRADPPRLEVGKGESGAGAGSLYYEAPVTLRFGQAPPERGSLVLRRVNGVDGASAEQLRWHIQRSTIGAGQ